ncbi:hypothetical protein PhaeoP83_01232 [Phaeobacter inhibens]|uniref:Uncharacterized protein n=2 Tax=Roseobacteraceae TaxID=2854170 RepID=A0ABN5GKD4_9RHOB|nr:hypothetical protein PhaeoP83_01232 [Phaeobacter inhibens]AUQ54719.1 hypothetical protein PhaeoP92_02052 [Phaeobacter inhibens]AUQ58954.1 hypothetical protein PhaeoP30_02051 [Phaeobacter inhibens]AUQ78735.1 hypothetical protein PhaeoP74_02053 [Phaeobacter inhibens]AUQ94078.1 hypothetical protein PhaeoP66_01279 [Phaeobacter inhibens]
MWPLAHHLLKVINYAVCTVQNGAPWIMITATPQHAALAAHPAAALQSSSRPAAANFADAAARTEPQPDPAAIAAIKARHDPSHVSPTEIDRMFDDLVGAGHPIDGDMLIFSTMGERFRSHLDTLTGTAPDYSQPIDLRQIAQDQRTLARQDNSSVAGWDSFLNFLDSFPARGEMTAANSLASRIAQTTLSDGARPVS